MSSISDNFPSPAPHEDALASARAAVIQVLTSTAEQRDQILQDTEAEKGRLLAEARTAAAAVSDDARGTAARIVSQAQAEAQKSLDQAQVDADNTRAEAHIRAEIALGDAKDTAERVRGDAAAEAHRIRVEADVAAREMRDAALAIVDEVRSALAGMLSIEARLALVEDRPWPSFGETTSDDDLDTNSESDSGTEPDHPSDEAPTEPVSTPEASQDSPIRLGPIDQEPAAVEPDEPVETQIPAEAPRDADETEDGSEADEPAPNPQLSTEDFTEFMRQLAEHLDTLDRARSTGDRAEVGRVLDDLGDLAERSHADDLATFARLLGPDARPEELDELIGHCYQVRFTQSVGS